MASGPRFSEAARVAAAAKRRERTTLAALNFNEPVVFALRAPAPDKGYIWEIRRFGGIAMERGTLRYDSVVEARHAGLCLLTAGRINEERAAHPALKPADRDG